MTGSPYHTFGCGRSGYDVGCSNQCSSNGGSFQTLSMSIYISDQPAIEAIEVLIAKMAYYVKRVGSGSDFHGDQGQGQITWSLHGGPAGAWEVAKERASFA